MTSMLTFANVKMRLAMIKSSLGNPMNDGTGLSDGMFGDGFKLAGGRFNPYNPDSPCSTLGCNQNGIGKVLSTPYTKGGFVDMVMESFAGPHDLANSSHFYDTNGNIRYLGYLSKLQANLLEYSTNYTSSLAFALPFASAAIAEQSNFSAYRYLK